MKVMETGFPGLVVLEPRVFADERGFFMETWNEERFRSLGLDCHFVQDNHAYSRDAGVLRGVHFQVPPKAQAKLVWVVRGRVLDVALDLRRGSPTYGRCYAVELSAENKLRLFLPRGFGHAYLTLEADTEFMYKVDGPYGPECEGGIAWNDPAVMPVWPDLPEGGPILSEKDRRLPFLEDFVSPFEF